MLGVIKNIVVRMPGTTMSVYSIFIAVSDSANTPTVTISQRRVRQISDPIQQMMHQLHKILYICQLPPTLDPNPRRRLVEKFKRALFAQDSNSLNLKTEVKKVSNLFLSFPIQS